MKQPTDRVPLPIVVLLPIEDLSLSAYRQPDPALGHVQSKVRAPSSGGNKEEQALRGSSPDIKREVGPVEEK